MNVPTVCILTSGKGSRLGIYTKEKNKSLLSLDKKSILSRILDKFPKKSKIIISLGYKGDQVKDFIKIHHPNLKVYLLIRMISLNICQLIKMQVII